MLPISHLFVLVVQIKVLPAQHNCPTTKLRESKMTTQGWVADRLSEWVKKNSNKGVKDAKVKVEGDYGIKLKYSKAWSDLKLVVAKMVSHAIFKYNVLVIDIDNTTLGLI